MNEHFIIHEMLQADPHTHALDDNLYYYRLALQDFDAFLKDYVFVDRDQVVVPSLNLKPAKVVICRDERQKKALRRMGFIEDRITIRNTRR